MIPVLSWLAPVAFAAAMTSSPMGGDPRVSPFAMIRWNVEVPEVRVEDHWYGLESIDGIATEDLLQHCREAYGNRWAKRFCEDLVQALREMGSPPGDSVSLVLTDLTTGESIELTDVPMTRENRSAIHEAEPRPQEVVNRISRIHQTVESEKFADLVRRYHDDSDRDWISSAHAAEDLDQFEWLLENELSYFGRLPVDYQSALDAIRLALDDGIHRNDFHIQLRKVLALFGDGHSRVSGISGALLPGFAPCRFADVGGRVAALSDSNDTLLDVGHPWVQEIDGVSIEKWLEATEPLVARGSSVFMRQDTMRYLAFIRHLRRDLSIPDGRTVKLRLAADNGETVELRRTLKDRPQFSDPWPLARTHQGRDDWGYLRIPSMGHSSEELSDLTQSLEAQLDRDTMILDVRGNGGGSRDALFAMLPYFLPADHGPLVVNVGARRLAPGVDANSWNLMGNRRLYRSQDPRWTPAEQSVIERFAESFTPEWPLAPGRFSDWHYAVVSPRPSLPSFAGRVMLLIDGGCFSATDIFVSAFAELPQVTLIGTTTSGGSGRSQTHRLQHSELAVRLSTMASFRTNGKLYDGNGIAPDIAVTPTLADRLGQSDSTLDRALEEILRTR